MTKTIERPGILLPEIDDATRREFLIGAAGLLLLLPAGCGGGNEDGSGASGETRTVRHALGETEVSRQPQRVVVTDGEVTLDPVVALGVDPVAASSPNYTGGIPDHIREQLGEEMADVGTVSEPNLERIASLDPELVIGSSPVVEGFYEQLSEIAPTVGLDYTQTQWKEYLREVGRVLERRDRAEQLLEDYAERARKLAGSLSGRTDEMTVTLARATDLGFRYLTIEGSFPGTVFQEVGLRTPPDQSRGGIDEPYAEISQEETAVLEADYIFLAVDEGTGTLEQLESNPLWSQLEGEKIEVPSSGWVFGNVLTASNILDDLERYLSRGE